MFEGDKKFIEKVKKFMKLIDLDTNKLSQLIAAIKCIY